MLFRSGFTVAGVGTGAGVATTAALLEEGAFAAALVATSDFDSSAALTPTEKEMEQAASTPASVRLVFDKRDDMIKILPLQNIKNETKNTAKRVAFQALKTPDMLIHCRNYKPI